MGRGIREDELQLIDILVGEIPNECVDRRYKWMATASNASIKSCCRAEARFLPN